MTSVCFVTRPVPSAIGPGGKHRSYQVDYELRSLFGARHVHTLSLNEWRAGHPIRPPRSVLAARFLRAAQRVLQSRENPLALFHPTSYTPRTFAPGPFVAHYVALLRTLPEPVVTLIDDARFTSILAVNQRRKIPTIACLQNFESLYQAGSDDPDVTRLRSRFVDFANEVDTLRQCTARFLISKIETGFLSGLGLTSACHPYLPVGSIRERLEVICRRRAQLAQDPDLFLMLGSAMHAPTRRAFTAILEQINAQGLPGATRLVLVGADTDKLPLPVMPGLTARGWVEQEELDRLLVVARAVLVPHVGGFGAVTRIVELSCAGTPTLVAEHAMRAIDPPPGVHVLDDAWAAWSAKIGELAQQTAQPSWDFAAWAKHQPRSLISYMARWA